MRWIESWDGSEGAPLAAWKAEMAYHRFVPHDAFFDPHDAFFSPFDEFGGHVSLKNQRHEPNT
jgi:hypothetical protein